MFNKQRYNNKGQAIVELAIFGSVILFVFGILLSHLQHLNDQQYAQMEAFRRTLEKACTHRGITVDGAGASAQVTLIENRRYADISDNYRKGSGQTVSASSSVFWAVPKLGDKPDSLITFRVNEDEKTVKYRDYISEEDYDRLDKEGNPRQRYRTLDTSNISSQSDTVYAETYTKQENPSGITTIRASNTRDTINTDIPFKIVEKDKDNKDYENVIAQGTLFSPTQGLYRDSSGQYKYSERAVGTQTGRSTTWQTNF